VFSVSRQLLQVSPDEPGGFRTVEEAPVAARATLDACEPTGSVGGGIRVDTAEPSSVLGRAVRDDRGAGLRRSRPGGRLNVRELDSSGTPSPAPGGTWPARCTEPLGKGTGRR
jgi:hypothetical protein